MRYRVTKTQARMVAVRSILDFRFSILDWVRRRFSIQNPKSKIKNGIRGQIVAEYFILFAVVAMLTLVGFTAFDDDIKRSLEGFLDAAAAKIAQ